MKRLKEIENSRGEEYGWLFWCPGCEDVHIYTTHQGASCRWDFNGDVQRPTFKPSLAVNRDKRRAEMPYCHLHLEEGQIRYCSDSEHHLAGKTIPLPAIPESWL